VVAYGGGVIRLNAGSLGLDGEIRANGGDGVSNGQSGGAGGSIWITVDGEIGGDGVIEANGGSVMAGAYQSAGGGGAISLNYGWGTGTVLSKVAANGGVNTQYTWKSGGAGTVYLHQAEVSTFGDLVVDNGGIGAVDTVMPSLGNGEAGGEPASTELVTGRSIQPYFVGHWVEIYVPLPDGTPGTLKGTWQIKSILDGTITFEDADPIPSINPSDIWQGVYLFDEVTVQNGATMTSVDPIRAPGWDLKREGVAVAPNLGQPEIDLTQVMVESGLVAGSYRILMTDQAIFDDEGISEIRISDAEGSVSGQDNGTVLWPGKPGSRPSITVIDDHPVVRFGRTIRLPALPGIRPQGQTLIMAENESCRHVVTDGPWVAVGDRSVKVFDRVDGALKAEFAGLMPIVGMATGNGYLVVARDHRLEVIDFQDLERRPTDFEIPQEYRVIDMVADDTRAVVLVEGMEDDSLTFSLATLSLLGEPTSIDLVTGPRFILDPSLVLERLLQTDERLYVTATDSTSEGGTILFSFPSDNLGADPESLRLEGVGSNLRSWSNGLIATSGTEIRLLQDDRQWTVTAKWTVEAEVLHASSWEDRLLLVAGGVALLYDIADPRNPRMVARLEGVAHREGFLGEVIVLYAPDFSAPPVILDESDVERLSDKEGSGSEWIEHHSSVKGGKR